MGAGLFFTKSAGERQKLQITAKYPDKGDLSFPAQPKSLSALANKAAIKQEAALVETLLFQPETLECGKFGNHEQ